MGNHLYNHLKRLETAMKKHKEENPIFNERNKYAVGALAIDGSGSIISLAFNSYQKTHPMMKQLASKTKRKEAIYLHAEVSALIKSKGQAKTIIVSRLTANNNIALARPCPICQMALKQAKIDQVYYTNNDGELVLFNLDIEEEKII